MTDDIAALNLPVEAIPSQYRFEGTRIVVEWRGAREGEDQDRWAVVNTGSVLARDGEWEYEPFPSSRDDEFFKRCRYTRLEALQFGAAAAKADIDQQAAWRERAAAAKAAGVNIHGDTG